MTNEILSQCVRNDIDFQVDKLLKDIKASSRPLNLDEVRYLLRLEKEYYSNKDVGLIKETVHRLRVGRRILIRSAGQLGSIIEKLKIKALFVPDKKRIYIDDSLPQIKKRWAEAHEIGHSIIPWHMGMMQGDEERTLSLECQYKLEAEANYAAGRLLFKGDQFKQRIINGNLQINDIINLAKEFGNSITSTLYRTIEFLDKPGFGLISQHPFKNCDNEKPKIRYFLRSPDFISCFSNVDSLDIFENVKKYCGNKSGIMGNGEITLRDNFNNKHCFYSETFFNHYYALTFGVLIGNHKKIQ